MTNIKPLVENVMSYIPLTDAQNARDLDRACSDLNRVLRMDARYADEEANEFLSHLINLLKEVMITSRMYIHSLVMGEENSNYKMKFIQAKMELSEILSDLLENMQESNYYDSLRKAELEFRMRR